VPDVSSPISTEGGVENGKVIREEGVGVAGGGREVGLRSSPSRRKRLTGGDVGGDPLSREEEDGDTGVVPLHWKRGEKRRRREVGQLEFEEGTTARRGRERKRTN